MVADGDGRLFMQKATTGNVVVRHAASQGSMIVHICESFIADKEVCINSQALASCYPFDLLSCPNNNNERKAWWFVQQTLHHMQTGRVPGCIQVSPEILDLP